MVLALSRLSLSDHNPAFPLPPTALPAPTITPPAPTPASLTLDMLRNGTYLAPYFGKTVTLVNGAYSGADNFSVKMLDMVAFGDMNGDGAKDAAIILVESGGGSGSFESLVAVLNDGGAPSQAGYAKLGDRVDVHSMEIAAGTLSLEYARTGAKRSPVLP